ncbi:MAG: CRISPR-associated protein Csx11 [Anaerolineaceae bacterium]|jgi:hypothetical protein|nr:MAG: CRISPR-associated protein Csx11 [Anaerolineaceae bacterium]
MSQLNTLAQHRDAILLAEVAALLHDDFKHTDAHVHEYTNNAPSPSGRQDTGDLIPTRSVNLLGKQLAFILVKNRKKDDFCDEYLNRCHYAAHIEKQDAPTLQTYPAHVSSPFGFENTQIPPNLTQDLRQKISWQKIASDPFTTLERNTLQGEIKTLFSRIGGDTRRPMNEVLLWEWSSTVAALYKAALAGALLGYQPQARDLRWRLLGVRVNGLDYLLTATRIPDLLAKQELRADGLNKVRELLEVTYPLGSEVYRDENGSLYIVPNVPDLLDCTDNSGASLRNIILQEFSQGTVKGKPNLRLGGEVVPHLELEQQPWWGQDPDWPNSANDELPKISDFLNRKFISSADANAIRPYWNGENADICTVCGLRPQGPGAKAKDRNVCDICEQRRADRSQEWATSQTDKTIWNDEVADVFGRLALITGQFDLHHWLDGRLLETLFVIAPHDPQNTKGDPVTSKNPSFSRLRRIWETTRTFWNEIQTEILQLLSDDRRRLKIYLDKPPRLGPFHAYDLMVGVSELSIVWVPPENNREGYLVSIDNLCYLAHRLGAESGIYKDPAASAIFVEDYLRVQFVEQSRQPMLYNADAPAGRGKKNLINGIFIREIGYQANQYATAIPVLAEPRSFMMLVPADKSLAILQRIKEKYEEEMGKVRDRLPLHLGCVYAHRRIPLHAMLDAGRAMFNQRTTFQEWSVKSLKTGAGKLELDLEREGYGIHWKIPLKMSDGNTEDRWYPYVFLETGGNDQNADAHTRRAFKTSRPDGNGTTVDCWIIHAADLRPGETIYLMPSTFDFLYLDAASRRFEIHYDENGRRSARPSRPYYLEDLTRLDDVWKCLKALTRTQLKQTLQTIETVRERWFGRDQERASANDATFRQFVEDTLATAQWPKEQTWKSMGIASPPEAARNDMQTKLITAAVRGELTDLEELHLEILKEKEEKQGVSP